MSGNISLTASMRSNLLSLQNISRTVGATQNKLATGNKVNSAIDNPSSYYTARSLNNRANDLDALLDSMGQAVSTIKTATTALETGATFLEQAAAVATSALETNTIPPKAFFEEKVGANGAVVTTAQELKDAVAAGKETIVVYGKIDYFTDESLQLNANQKLVGTEYFTGYTGKEKFSQLNFEYGASVEVSAIYSADNTLISDLDITYNNTSAGGAWGAIQVMSDLVKLNNLDVNVSAQTSPNNVRGGIMISAGTAEISGHINVSVSGQNISAILPFAIHSNKVDLNIQSGAVVNLDVQTASGFGIYSVINGNINVNSQATVNIKTISYNSIYLRNNSVLNIYGQINYNKEITTVSDSVLNLYHSGSLVSYDPSSPSFAFGNVYIEEGATFIDADGNQKYTVAQTYNNQNTSIRKSNITTVLDVAAQNYEGTDDWWNWPEKINNTSSDQYKAVLHQYDTLVKDSSYKGVNLLKNEKLNVRFNEKGNADLDVSGKDMSSNALGLNTVDWQNQGDIAQSLKEIAGALKSIRAFTAELGNNYSIITNRQEFTENLINILTEGADKLTLADMNEESANMLSLQTRQQLAINSLSLASQAAQAVLKLF